MGRATPDEDLRALRLVAKHLGDLLNRTVFIGGCAVGLLITDPAAPEILPTQDVDIIVQIKTLSDFYAFDKKLIKRGFKNHLDGPLCRYEIEDILLDVMPTESNVLNLKNQWYQEAMSFSSNYHLEKGLTIRLISAPYFIATKLDAFLDRGQDDFTFSKDLEDIVEVIDGRPALLNEISSACTPQAQSFISETLSNIKDDLFPAIQGFLGSSSDALMRVPFVKERITEICEL